VPRSERPTQMLKALQAIANPASVIARKYR
jgi:hypothetical protein